MVFIDILAAQLFVLGFIGLMLAYLTIDAYLLYSKGKAKQISRIMQSAAIPLMLLGFYAFISGLYGQFTWPLPGSYNILFYDVFTLLGLLVMGFAWAVRSGMQTKYIGLFALMLAYMVILYGISGWSLGMTLSPFFLLLLYLGFGASGILAYSATIALDRIMGGAKVKPVWIAAVALFALMLILGSALAIIIATSAVPAHLLSPP